MKIKFVCCGITKEVYYVEQTPKSIIEDDFKEWCNKVIIMNSRWEYAI